MAGIEIIHSPSTSIPNKLFPPPFFPDPSLEGMCGTEHAQLGEDGQRPPRCTSTTSSQSEPSEQLRHQGKILASEDPKKKRAQKPSHMRRNIRWAVFWVRKMEGNRLEIAERLTWARMSSLQQRQVSNGEPSLIVKMAYLVTHACHTSSQKVEARESCVPD